MSRVAIQLITYFSSEDLPRWVECLKKQTYTDWELFVVDNSCDETEHEKVREILLGSGIQHRLTINQANNGFVAHNQMFGQHNAERVLILNDDCFLESEYVAETVKRMDADPTCAAVTGLIYRDETRSFVDTSGLLYECLGHVIDDHKVYSEARSVFGVSGTASLLRRSAIESTQPPLILDPSFFMHKEDVERALRLQKHGYTAWLEPKAVAVHERGIKETGKGWASRIRDEKGRSIANRVQTYKNQWTIYRRYFSWRLGFVDIVCTCWHELKRSASLFVFGGPGIFFKTWKEIIKEKEPRVAGPAAAVSHTSSSASWWTAGGMGALPSASPATLGLFHSPKVGIIYFTFATPDWREDIPRAMRSLEKIDYPAESLELICVESKSTSGERVKEWFEQEWMPKSEKELPRVSYVFNDEKIGFAGNEQRGLNKAKELGCQYIFMLNQDAEIHPDAIRFAVERAEQDSRIAYVQSLILLGQDRQRVNTIGNAFQYLGYGYSNGYLWTVDHCAQQLKNIRMTNPELEIAYASWAGVLGRISVIDACGPFDDGFFLYHEDTDGSLQARVRGYRVVLEPRSIVYHHYDFSKSITKYYWMERNRWVLVFSYYRWQTLLLIAPMAIIVEIGQFGFSLVKGWWREKLKVYRELLRPSFWRWIGQRRAKIQSERVLSDKELLSNAVATIEFQGEAIKNPVLDHIANPLMKAYWSIVKRMI